MRSGTDALLRFVEFVSVVHREPRVNSKVLTVCLAVLATVVLVVDIGLGGYCESAQRMKFICPSGFRHHYANAHVCIKKNNSNI